MRRAPFNATPSFRLVRAPYRARFFQVQYCRNTTPTTRQHTRIRAIFPWFASSLSSIVGPQRHPCFTGTVDPESYFAVPDRGKGGFRPVAVHSNPAFCVSRHRGMVQSQSSTDLATAASNPSPCPRDAGDGNHFDRLDACLIAGLPCLA